MSYCELDQENADRFGLTKLVSNRELKGLTDRLTAEGWLFLSMGARLTAHHGAELIRRAGFPTQRVPSWVVECTANSGHVGTRFDPFIEWCTWAEAWAVIVVEHLPLSLSDDAVVEVLARGFCDPTWQAAGLAVCRAAGYDAFVEFLRA